MIPMIAAIGMALPSAPRATYSKGRGVNRTFIAVERRNENEYIHLRERQWLQDLHEEW
jgi:hypothetical protein